MFPFARSSTGARPGRVLPGRGCSCSGWSGKWLGVFYKFKFIFTIWLSIFIYFKRMQTRVLLFYSRIVEIHVQTKPTTSLVNATALQSSWTVSAGGGGAGRCCGRGSAPAARPPPLLGTRSASPAAASHPITRGAQSQRLKEGPSFEIALILVKWQRPLKITLS